MNPPSFCRVRYLTEQPMVGPEDENLSIDIIVTHDCHDFPHFECYLHHVFDMFATKQADWQARNFEHMTEPKDNYDKFGGYCVRVENALGGEIEIGMSKTDWLLMLWNPEPFRVIRNGNDRDGNHGFVLFDNCHTDFSETDLISKTECLAWLISGCKQ